MVITGQVPGSPVRSADRAVQPEPAPRIFGHQDSLDGLRVVAALAVLVVHVAGATGFAFTGTPASWVASHGDVGVPVFFTLSGLLLYRPWALAALRGDPAPDLRRYLVRRVLRIVPIYWVVTAIAIVTVNQRHAASPATWAQYLFFAQIYDPRPWWAGTGAPGLAQMWSLAVEASFYAALPAIGALLTLVATKGTADIRVRARRLLIAIAVLACLSYGFLALIYLSTRSLLWLGETLPRSLTWFAPGMAIAVVAVWATLDDRADSAVRAFCRTLASCASACWLIAGFAFVIACTPLAGPEDFTVPSLWQYETKLLLYAVVATAVVAPAAFQHGGRTRLSAVLGNKLMKFLGKVSYGIFLWQFLAIYALFGVIGLPDAFHGGSFSAPESVGLLIAVGLVTVAMATAGYYLVELPALRLYRSHRPTSSNGRHRLRGYDASATATEPAPSARLRLQPRFVPNDSDQQAS